MHFSTEIWEKIWRLWQGRTTGDRPATDEEMKSLIREWFPVRRALLSTRSHEIDTAKAWERMEARIRSGHRKATLTRLRFAALFILGIGLCVYLLDGNGRGKEGPDEGIFPSGSHRAELILAGGERIVLKDNWSLDSSLSVGTRFENNLKKGELRYRNPADPCRNVEELREEQHSLIVPKGGDYSIILPDGTKVWLNSESSFRFPALFGERGREVWLDGEAYFRVASDGTPFRVHLPLGTVLVTGTSFNVSAYRNDDNWHTVLEQGSVTVSSVNGEITLKPSDMYSVSRKTGVGSLRQVDASLYTAWVDGKFHFNAFPFEEIVKKLERWYDFEMVYADEDIRKMHFTGTVNKHRPLEDVLHFLERTIDIHFDICGRKITVSRTRQER